MSKRLSYFFFATIDRRKPYRLHTCVCTLNLFFFLPLGMQRKQIKMYTIAIVEAIQLIGIRQE